MKYSERLIDHLKNPKHKGDLPAPSVVGESRYPPCGDKLRLSIRTERDLLAEVGFVAFGCAAAQAAGSAAAANLTGKSLEEARQVTAFEIDDWLGGVPIAKRHAILMVLECIHNAIGPRPGSDQPEKYDATLQKEADHE